MSEQSEHAPVDGRSALRDYLAILWLRKWSVILVTLLVLGGALLYSFRQAELFRSSVRILMQSGGQTTTSPAAGGVGGTGQLVLQAEAEILRSTAVAEQVAEQLGQPAARPLLSGLTVEMQPESQILVVSYISQDPIEAQRRAQAFAEAYLTYRRQQFAQELRQQRTLLNRQMQELEADLAEVNEELSGLSATDPNRALVQQEASILNSEISLLRQQLTTLTLSGQQVVGHIMEPANLPSAPTSPNHFRTGAVAGIVGLFLGIAVAFLRERLDDRLRGRADLERHLGAPVLAIVPHLTTWRRKTDTPLVTATEPRSGVSEAYRTLRTSLLFATGQRGAKTLLITSAHAGEGKTATAANLGVSMAQAGKRVILLSADLRKPRLHRFFEGRVEEIGLTSILSGEVKPWEGVTDVGVENLRLVPSGPVPGNPAELLGSDAMGRLLAQFREIADLVIIDSAPVLVVADALAVAPFVDAVLFVADAERTKRGAVVHARQQLEQVDAPVIGAVLNNFDPSKGRKAAYYYYGYYYSHYQYTDGARQRRRLRGRRQPPATGFEPTPMQPAQDGPGQEVWSPSTERPTAPTASAVQPAGTPEPPAGNTPAPVAPSEGQRVPAATEASSIEAPSPEPVAPGPEPSSARPTQPPEGRPETSPAISAEAGRGEPAAAPSPAQSAAASESLAEPPAPARDLFAEEPAEWPATPAHEDTALSEPARSHHVAEAQPGMENLAQQPAEPPPAPAPPVEPPPAPVPPAPAAPPQPSPSEGASTDAAALETAPPLVQRPQPAQEEPVATVAEEPIAARQAEAAPREPVGPHAEPERQELQPPLPEAQAGAPEPAAGSVPEAESSSADDGGRDLESTRQEEAERAPEPPQWVPTQPEPAERERPPSQVAEWFARDTEAESPASPNEHAVPASAGAQAVETGPEPAPVSDEPSAAPGPASDEPTERPSFFSDRPSDEAAGPPTYPREEAPPHEHGGAETVRRE